MLPARKILGRLRRSACGAEETDVLWFVDFDLDDEAAWGPVRDDIEAPHRSGIDGLESHARRETLPFSGVAQAGGRR